MIRQFLFDAWHFEMLQALTESSEPRVAEIAAKSIKEVTYHLERSSDSIVRLGDGTAESNQRMQAALDRFWPYIGEMFTPDATDNAMHKAGIAPDLAALRPAFDARLSAVLAEATLVQPEDDFAHIGGKTGLRQTEHLGHMLATMQVLPRSYPEASW